MKDLRKIIKNVLMYLSTILFIFSLILVFISLKNKKLNNLTYVFNHSYSVVVTPSMDPEIKVGDIIIVKKLDFETYLPNAKIDKDVLVYKSKKNIFIVHKLYEIDDNNNLILKGVNNDVPDDELVNESNFEGIVVYSGLNFIGSLLIGNRALILLIFIIFLVYVFITESVNLTIKRKKLEEKELKELLRKEVLEELKKELENEI